MHSSWIVEPSLLSGGTVLGVGQVAQMPWLLAEAGLFFFDSTSSVWRAAPVHQPVLNLSTFTTSVDTLLVANNLGQIAYSRNAGETWYRGRVPQTNAPITSLVVSPRFVQDQVALAGTGGDGVLRTRDGGRSWQLVNVGLEDFEVLALAVAPQWDQREICFAATVEGVYRSPNGGRAWKRSADGLEGSVVLALATSSNFAQDQTVFAATEADGCFRSVDGGRKWQPINTGLAAQGQVPSLNALLVQADATGAVQVWLGAGDGRVFRSLDCGQSWEAMTMLPAPVLSLGECAGQLYAGLDMLGIAVSSDGESWTVDQTLAAHNIATLTVGAQGRLYALGPGVGVWSRAANEATWQAVAGLPEAETMLSLACDPDGTGLLSVGSDTGLHLRRTDQVDWQTVPVGVGIARIVFSTDFAQDQTLWLVTQDGRLLVSQTGGQQWQLVAPPRPGLPIVNLAARGAAVWVATFGPRNQVSLWHSANGGRSWRGQHQVEVQRPVVQFLWLASDAPQVSVDQGIWQVTSSAWEQVFRAPETIIALDETVNGTKLALTRETLFAAAAGQNWLPFEPGPETGPWLDLARHESTLYLLGVGGRIATFHQDEF